MIGTVAAVVRGEGVASALVRTRERIGEALRDGLMRMRRGSTRAEILNVSAMSVAPRIGGVAIQLRARLRVESRSRNVALLHPGGLEVNGQLLRVTDLREALAITGAKLLHIEGTFGLDTDAILRLRVPFIVSVHDSSASRELLAAAAKVVFPSSFLRDAYGVDGAIIEPGVAAPEVQSGGNGFAFAGSVKRHKGAQLLPDVALMLGTPLHVFGGGDEDLFHELRRVPNIVIHGYYRAGTLPSLLAKHRIGIVVLPSIVPESYGLVLSEGWLAGAAVAAFDHGAIAERIHRAGGGWLAPLDSGAAGLADVIRRREPAIIPTNIASPEDAAKAYLELYRT
jgi:hypothetical protein